MPSGKNKHTHKYTQKNPHIPNHSLKMCLLEGGVLVEEDLNRWQPSPYSTTPFLNELKVLLCGPIHA